MTWRTELPVVARHGRRRWRTVGAVLAVLVCAVVVARFFHGVGLRAVRDTGADAMPSMPLAALGISPSDDAGAASAWLPEVEERFEPSVCPSLEAAARALGRRIAPLLAAVVPERKAPSLILLSADRFDGVDPALAAVASVLRSSHDAADVRIEPAGPEEPAYGAERGAVTVRLDLARAVEHDPTDAAAASGPAQWTLRATASGAAGQRTAAMAYVSKPWLADFSAFVSRTPSRRWALGRCAQLATDPQAAERQALADAARQLAQEAVGGRPGSAHVQAEVAARVLAELRDNRFVVDRFAQRLSRPYGDLWRHAVLLSAEPAELAELVRSVGADHRAGRQAALATVLAVAALALLVCGLYLFLNAATRGYYGRSLRVVLGLLAIACLVLLFLVR